MSATTLSTTLLALANVTSLAPELSSFAAPVHGLPGGGRAEQATLIPLRADATAKESLTSLPPPVSSTPVAETTSAARPRSNEGNSRLRASVSSRDALTTTYEPSWSTASSPVHSLDDSRRDRFWHEVDKAWQVASDKLVAAPIKATAAILLVVSAGVTWFYLERDAHWAYLFTSVMGFHLALSAILLAPYDVWEALALRVRDSDGENSLNVEETLACTWEHLIVFWRILYATICVLCYIVMPVMIEFEATPGFTFQGRIRVAIRMNVAYYVAYILIGIVLVVWLCHQGKFNGTADIAAFGIATSHAYALLLITGLMGFGLVAMPQHLLFMSSLSRQQRASYSRVLGTHRARDRTRNRLRDLVKEAHIVLSQETDNVALRLGLTVLQKTLQDCQAYLWSQLPSVEGDVKPTTDVNDPEHPNAYFYPNTRKQSLASLAHLCHELKLARRAANLEACRWEHVVQNALVLQDIMELQRPSARWSSRVAWRKLATLYPRIVRPWICWGLAWVCGLYSGLIATSQLVTSTGLVTVTGWNFLSPLALPFLENHGFIASELLCVIPLCYMAVATYWSIFRLEISGMYCIYANHYTDVCSILMCSKYTAQLACPICYQFILLLNLPGPPGSALESMMGTIYDVPFAVSVSNLASVLIVIIIFSNLLGVYSRVVRKLGLKALDFGRQDFEEGESDNRPSVEAQALIAQERVRLRGPSASLDIEPDEPTELTSLIASNGAEVPPEDLVRSGQDPDGVEAEAEDLDEDTAYSNEADTRPVGRVRTI